MKEKWLNSESSDIAELENAHPEITALMARLTELEPKELALALYHLETFKEAPYLSCYQAHVDLEQNTQLFFSRGLKQEFEAIYLDLARHLKSRSKGSHDLMNAVFDFLGKTLTSMIDVPYLVSMN